MSNELVIEDIQLGDGKEVVKGGVLQGSWRVSCVFKLLFSVSVAPALG